MAAMARPSCNRSPIYVGRWQYNINAGCIALATIVNFLNLSVCMHTLLIFVVGFVFCSQFQLWEQRRTEGSSFCDKLDRFSQLAVVLNKVINR